jgi:hypothetical protein
MAGGMQLVVRVLAMGLGATLVLNYMGGRSLTSPDALPTAVLIAIVNVLIEMYLPLAEAYIDGKL